MHVLGYWKFEGGFNISVSLAIEQGDIIKVLYQYRDRVYAFHRKRIVSFDTKYVREYFIRPEKGHDPSQCSHKEIFGLDCSKCEAWRKRHNITRPMRNIRARGKRSYFSPIDCEEEIKRFAAMGKTYQEIASELNLYYNSLANYCWRHGIKTVSQGTKHVQKKSEITKKVWKTAKNQP